MCRSIKNLNNPEQFATAEELSNAALQYVRKISGYRKPSQANQQAFERAVDEIAQASQRLLEATRRPVRRTRASNLQAHE